MKPIFALCLLCLACSSLHGQNIQLDIRQPGFIKFADVNITNYKPAFQGQRHSLPVPNDTVFLQIRPKQSDTSHLEPLVFHPTGIWKRKGLEMEWVPYRSPQDPTGEYEYFKTGSPGDVTFSNFNAMQVEANFRDEFDALSLRNVHANLCVLGLFKKCSLVEISSAFQRLELKGSGSIVRESETGAIGTLALLSNRVRTFLLEIQVKDVFADSDLSIDTVYLGVTQQSVLSIPPLTGKKPRENCKLIIGDGADVFSYKFNYIHFDLTFPRGYKGDQYQRCIEIYNGILNMQRINGFSDGYEKADKELQSLKYKHDYRFGSIINWLDRNWWGYGYNRGLIFPNTLILFGTFFVLNLLFFNILSKTVYPVPEITIARITSLQHHNGNRITVALSYSIHCFIYTLYLFFGLEMKIEKLKLTNKLLALLIVVQYMAGILCLAYFGAYILKR